MAVEICHFGYAQSVFARGPLKIHASSEAKNRLPCLSCRCMHSDCCFSRWWILERGWSLLQWIGLWTGAACLPRARSRCAEKHLLVLPNWWMLSSCFPGALCSMLSLAFDPCAVSHRDYRTLQEKMVVQHSTGFRDSSVHPVRFQEASALHVRAWFQVVHLWHLAHKHGLHALWNRQSSCWRRQSSWQPPLQGFCSLFFYGHGVCSPWMDSGNFPISNECSESEPFCCSVL